MALTPRTRLVAAAAIVAVLAACVAPPPGPPPAGPPPDGLRQLHIGTAGAPVTTTADYVAATYRLVSPTGAEEAAGATEIRGRGNTTWSMPKRPYRLKLARSTPLAGMPADRDWALLANYADKTMVRNRLAVGLGEELGLAYSPRSVFVELFLDGSYEGVYEMYEHIEIGSSKIDAPELDPDVDVDPATITGGYYLEIDHRLDEDVCWTTTGNVPVCSKDPEFDPQAIADPTHPSHAQYAYITGYVDAAEAAIKTPGDGYEEYFDVDSMVRWYIVSELMRNNDAQIKALNPGSTDWTSSVKLSKPRGGRLTFGPLWDHDIGAGNIDYNGNGNTAGWWIRSSDWHAPLFAHSSFGSRVLAAWCQAWSDGTIARIPTRINAIVGDIGPSNVIRNFERWPIIGTYVWPNGYVGTSYIDEVNHLQRWMTRRAAWMHAELQREFGACPAT